MSDDILRELRAMRAEMTRGFAEVRGDIAQLRHLVQAGFDRDVDTRTTQADVIARLVAVEDRVAKLEAAR